MPKRYGNLYDEIVSLENIYAGYLQARRGKRKTRSVMLFEKDLGNNLQQIHCELASLQYCPAPYRHFVVYGAKARNVAAPTFRDVVVQHAIYRVVGPIFDRTFLSSSYGCRVGGGAHRANDYLQNSMRKASQGSHILQLDIRKYYYSINHNILEVLIRQKIKDERLVRLMLLMTKDGQQTVGLPIGNLLSQLYALIYLNKMDHWIKRRLKPFAYCRYVDDFVLILPSKKAAADSKLQIETWLLRNLHLSLSKWSIVPISRGCNFVGFRTWKSRRYVRKRSLHNFSRSLKKRSVDSLVSIMGHAHETSTLSYYFRKLIDSDCCGILPTKMRSRHAILLHSIRHARPERG